MINFWAKFTSSDALASLPGLFLKKIPWKFCLGMFLWQWCEAGGALTMSNTNFLPIFGSSWHSCLLFSSFILPGGDRGWCPGCQLPAGRAQDEQVADFLLWGAGECRNLGKFPWIWITQSWSCHISILLPKKGWKTSTGWEWGFQGIPGSFQTLSLPAGPGILNPDFPMDNRFFSLLSGIHSRFPIFPGILIFCNSCQYFQCTPSIIPLLKYIPDFQGYISIMLPLKLRKTGSWELIWDYFLFFSQMF